MRGGALSLVGAPSRAACLSVRMRGFAAIGLGLATRVLQQDAIGAQLAQE